MAWLTTAADFLLSEWLWNVTWGWYHIPVNTFMMLFLLKFFGRMRIMPSVLLSVFSQLFSFLLLSLIVVVGPMYLLGLTFTPYDCYVQQAMHPIFSSLFLGAIYFLFQIIFFVLVNLSYKLNLRLVILISLVSNLLSALIVYRYWGYSFLG